MTTRLRYLRQAGRTLLISLLMFFGLLFLLQKRLIYFPSRAPEADLSAAAQTHGIQPWTNPQNEIIGWRASPIPSSPPAARLVVFHGNAGFALHRTYFLGLPPASWEVLLFEYPGYGARSGSPGESALKAAALEAVDSLATPGSPPVYLAGESLGSAVAAWLASQRPDQVDGLLLITPMTSLVDAARFHYPLVPVNLLLRERYDSVSALRAFPGPVAIVVADQDEVVPASLGRRLHDTRDGPKQLWEQPGATHNTLDFTPAWWSPVFAWLTASN